MAKINRSIIGELQSKTFKEKIDTSLNGVDIDFLGRNRKSPSLIIKNGYDAHVNRALFWLSSKRDDYIRESFKGGVLYDLLGIIGNNPNLSEWEENIKRRFNEEFSSDLELLLVNLKMNKMKRTLSVNIIVRDKIENRTFPATMEVRI